MANRDVWDSQIVITLPNGCVLVGRFEELFLDFVELIDGAFALGMQNPCAEGLIVAGSDGGFSIAEDLKNCDSFMEVFIGRLREADSFCEALRKFSKEHETYQAEARARATEEPKDAAWQIRALEYSLEEEKAWSAKLGDEVEELKGQLRSEQYKTEQLSRRLKNPSRMGPRNRLSMSIAETLPRKAEATSKDL